MKIGTELQYEVPDDCPEDCKYKNNKGFQGDICCRCPIFNCKDIYDEELNEHIGAMLQPNEYRDDWAKEWVEFFKTGKEPELYLFKE